MKDIRGYDDVLCGSKFVLSIIHEVVEAICTKFNWVVYYNLIYLVTENSGGNVTKDTVDMVQTKTSPFSTRHLI